MGINFGPGEAGLQPRTHVAAVWTAVTQLVRCDSFVIERVRMVEGVEADVSVGEFMVWMVLEGRGEIGYPGGETICFERGDTVLIPAGLREARFKACTQCTWLEVTVPLPSDLAGFERPDRAQLAEPQRYVPLNIAEKPPPS